MGTSSRVDPQQIRETFKKTWNEEPLLVRSPGRVNLIGEHTDYNQGFVMPAAIDKAIFFALSASGSDRCSVIASNLPDSFEFSLGAWGKSDQGWPNYLLGVVEQIQDMDLRLRGFNCVFGGDIPVGAGLSSSAALECGLAFALNELFALGMDKWSLARLSQRAEQEFVGLECGIMDQFANLFGLQDHFLLLDCHSLDYQALPFLFEEVEILLFDTRVAHSLAASEYNLRRRQCEQGVRYLQRFFPGLRSLRDVSVEMLEEKREEMDAETWRRCAYVVRENARVLQVGEALREGRLEWMGEKMFDSHAGLRDDYEVSCPQLDHLVELAASEKGVLGARLMGGGFGGCTINLVRSDAVAEASDRIQSGYQAKFGKDLGVYAVAIGPGTSLLT
ncbi:MAG: galactokinase [Acidobacteriota bacterium]